MIHVGQCAWSIIEHYINIMVHVQTFDHLRSRTPWKHGAKTELHECLSSPLLLCCIRMYQPNAAHCFSPWKPKDVPCTSPQTVPLRPTSLYYLFSSLTLISVFEWIIQGIPRSLNHSSTIMTQFMSFTVVGFEGTFSLETGNNYVNQLIATQFDWSDEEILSFLACCLVILSCHFVSPGMRVARHKCVQAKWNEWDFEIFWWWNCRENKHKEGEEEESITCC